MALPHSFRVGRSGAQGAVTPVGTFTFAMVGGGGHQGQDGPSTIGGHGGASAWTGASMDGAVIATWHYVVGQGGGNPATSPSSGRHPLQRGGGGSSPNPLATSGHGGGFTGLFTGPLAPNVGPSVAPGAIAIVGGGGGGSWGDNGGSGGSVNQPGGNGTDTGQQPGGGGTLSNGGPAGNNGSPGNVLGGAGNPGTEFYSSSGGGGYYGGGSMNQNDGAGGAGSGGGSGYIATPYFPSYNGTYNSSLQINGPGGPGGFQSSTSKRFISAGQGNFPSAFSNPGAGIPSISYCCLGAGGGSPSGVPGLTPYGKSGSPGFLRIQFAGDGTEYFNTASPTTVNLPDGCTCSGPLAPFFA